MQCRISELQLALFIFFREIWSETLSASVIRPQSVFLREKLKSSTAPPENLNKTNYDFSKRPNFTNENMVEIRTNFQAQLTPVRTVDSSYTAPPLTDMLNPSIPAASPNEEDRSLKAEENNKENNKQSILLSQGKKFKNGHKMFSGSPKDNATPKNSGQIPENWNKPFGSEDGESSRSWNQSAQIFKETAPSFSEVEQISGNRDPENHGSRNYDVQPIQSNQFEELASGNQQNEQPLGIQNQPLTTTTKSILTIYEADRNGDDSDLLVKNLDSAYQDLLTPKPSIWSDAVQFIDKMSQQVDFGSRKSGLGEYSGLHERKNLSSMGIGTIYQQSPSSQLNPSHVSRTVGYHQIPKIPNRIPAPRYQQNPASFDSGIPPPVFIGPQNELVTPIVPINGIFGNPVGLGPPGFSSALVPNPVTVRNAPNGQIFGASMFNDIVGSVLQTDTRYEGHASLPTLIPSPLLTLPPIFPSFMAPKIPIGLSFDDATFLNGVPPLSTTMKTSKPSYQRLRVETGGYGNWRAQKEPEEERGEESYAGLGKSDVTTDRPQNWASLIPASEFFAST